MKNVPYFKIQPKTNRYQYLWLKYVKAFNPNVHCTRCLVGHFSKIIPFRKIPAGTIYEGYMNEVNYDFVGYICGVSNSYADNLHIAFKYKKGATIEFENKLVIVSILDAEQLPITPILEPIEKGKEFTTCRNYQFAYNYYGGNLLPKQIKLEL